MPYITKAKMLQNICKKSGVSKVTCQLVIQAFLEEMKAALLDGESFFLKGFGHFGISFRQSRKVHYFKKGVKGFTDGTIPPRGLVHFRPEREFREAMVATTEERYRRTGKVVKDLKGVRDFED